MSEDNIPTRRNVLRGIGAGLAVAIGGSGLAAAEKGGSNQAGTAANWIAVENDRFVLNTTAEEIGESEYQMYREGIEKFNKEIEAGRLRLVKTASQLAASEDSMRGGQAKSMVDRASQYVLLSSEKTAPSAKPDNRGISISATSCNRQDMVITDPGTIVPGEYWVDFYLSDGFINDVSALAFGGGVTGPHLKRLLVSRGILAAGALSASAVVAITVAMAAEWTWIMLENNGCGVKIETGYSPVNPTYVLPTVEPQ
ncbi:hypothetical protein FQU85_09160 [Salarchaeum sp. JOR-1]|nr:hypothetical protein FQU85_09160 [Salarchaeum sp. JOR-1]